MEVEEDLWLARAFRPNTLPTTCSALHSTHSCKLGIVLKELGPLVLERDQPRFKAIDNSIGHLVPVSDSHHHHHPPPLPPLPPPPPPPLGRLRPALGQFSGFDILTWASRMMDGNWARFYPQRQHSTAQGLLSLSRSVLYTYYHPPGILLSPTSRRRSGSSGGTKVWQLAAPYNVDTEG